MPAIFHRVQKDFSESEDDSFGDVGVSNAPKELDQAISSGDVASRCQANPRRRSRKYFDTVIPTGGGHSSTHHFGNLRAIERSREVTESSFANGRNDVSGSKSIGEDNQADVSASTPDFVKKLNIFRPKHLPPGDDQVEWLGRRHGKSVLIVSGSLNAPAVAG